MGGLKKNKKNLFYFLFLGFRHRGTSTRQHGPPSWNKQPTGFFCCLQHWKPMLLLLVFLQPPLCVSRFITSLFFGFLFFFISPLCVNNMELFARLPIISGSSLILHTCHYSLPMSTALFDFGYVNKGETFSCLCAKKIEFE